jgi:transcriptional regulator
VRNLEINTLWDGIFHASTYVFVALGLAILWQHTRQTHVRWIRWFQREQVDSCPMAKRSDDRTLDLLQGTLDMLILRTLQWGPQHGHGIGQAIRARSDDLLKVETGSLYPALHRLEKRGWLKSEWDVSEANQRAKYYRLTAAGKAQLSREQDRWSQMVQAIGRIMNPAPAPEE